jgi:hypothetical protein
LVDRPPPSRYRIVERRGRLEIIDLETGTTPPTAAERMAVHDAAQGNAALKSDQKDERLARAAALDAAAKAVQELNNPAPITTTNRPTDPIRARLEARPGPWQAKGDAKPPKTKAPPPAPAAQPGPGRSASAGADRMRGNQTFVTGKWWDNKGPRTVTLGPAGRAKLTNGILGIVVVGFFIALAMLVVQPALLLVAGFVLFRFGGTMIGPVGARLVDEAIRAEGRRG